MSLVGCGTSGSSYGNSGRSTTKANRGSSGHRAERAVAERAATEWLRYVDAGEYAQSWGIMSQDFRSQSGPDEWAGMVGTVRIPLGVYVDRKLMSSEYYTELPGWGPGKYVLVRLIGRYSQRFGTTEFISLSHDADGMWRVNGYVVNGGRPFDESVLTPEDLILVEKQWEKIDEKSVSDY